MMRCKMMCLSVALGVALFSPVSAQVSWDSPLLIGPGSPGGISLFLVDPGEGLGAMAQWQGGGRRSRMGFRAGLAETHADEIAVFGGIDFTGVLVDHSDEFPLDVIWVTGAGLSVGENAVVTIPLGVSLGRVVTENDVWFHPYLTPHLVVDAHFGDAEAHSHGNLESHTHTHDDLDLGLVLDLGADFSFSGSWVLRIGASVGQRGGLAIGFSIPT